MDLIAAKVQEALAEQGFARQDGYVEEENGASVWFLSETLAYSVYYDNPHKRFELRSSALEGGKPGKWKSLSMWLYDPETDSPKDTESISNDFVETIQGPKRVELAQQAKRKKKKDEESSNDPVFFFNRMVGVFPELKAEMNEERATYGQVRAVTFARERLLPKMEQLAAHYPGSEPYRRMCSLLGDMYQSGDMDVRSLITMTLLNGFQDEAAVSAILENTGEDLQKAYPYAKKYKGKTVKPEKRKKQSKLSKFRADTLNEMNR